MSEKSTVRRWRGLPPKYRAETQRKVQHQVDKYLSEISDRVRSGDSAGAERATARAAAWSLVLAEIQAWEASS